MGLILQKRRSGEFMTRASPICREPSPEMDDLWVYDNSKFSGPPRLLLESGVGAVRFLVDDPPVWLTAALGLG
jgi:hypothetical protein